MANEPAAELARLSRRSLLGGVIGAAGILGAMPNQAKTQPKISNVAVNYQDQPDGDKRHNKRAQCHPPDACKVVEGSISPEGSCRIFILKHA